MNNDGQAADPRIAELEAALAEAQRNAEELQAANDQLRNVEKWYEGATNAADVGTWAWDLKTNKLYWTKSCKALFGLPPDSQVDYKIFSELLHPEDRQAVDEAVQRALRDLDEYDVQSRILWPDGTVRWLRFKGRAYADRSGRAVRFQGIVIDIWRQKQAEAELREALDREREVRERALAAERNAQMILESMAEGFCGMDSELRYTYVNAAAEAIVGRKREELIGRTMQAVFPEAAGTDMEAICRRALAEGKAVEVSTLFDAWNRWFNIKIYPSETGLTIYFREITSQKQMEITLLDTQERFEMINNFIPVMAFTTRPDGHVDYVNRRWTEYTAASAEILQGWGWTDLIHPDDRDRTIARWHHSLQSGEPFEMECRFLRSSDHSYRWFLPQAVPVRDRHGRTVRWFGTCTDIEDRKRVEAELAAARQTAEEASQAKSQFLASMSHELRTPLNAIIGYSEMLQEEVEDLGASQLAPDLGRIHTAGKHLLSLISDILDLSKIEAGKMDIFVEEVEIAKMVEEVAGTVQPLIEKNANHLELSVQPGIGSMTSDVTKVRQALFNLLSNASKFTTEGQISMNVSAEKQHGLDWIVFRVSDTGIGMQPEKLDKLFEPFAQLHSGAVKAGGTGLGLAITKRFSEMLGGEITVDSQEGKGSTFTIRLPRNGEQSARSDRQPDRDAQALSVETKARGRGLILVVDDDANARELMRRYLTREGYSTVLASSGEEALKLVREVKPNVITLDVMMPGMDGWAVLQALKADPETNCVPVVMVTMVGDRSLGFALGAADFVVKPVTREKLSSLMSRFRCASPPCRVLVVEDDDNSRELVRNMFEREGWLVDAAANGAEGLAAVRERRPSLILLDLMMPVMDGFEFTAQLRKSSEFREIPIVVLTARDITAADRQRLAGNVEKVLSKGNLSNEEVLAEVRELIASCM